MAKESTPLVIDASETSSIDDGDVHRPRRRRSAMTSVAAVGVISMVLGRVLILAGGRSSDEHVRVGGILNWVFRGRVRPEVTFTLDASWIDPRVRAANPDFFTSPISDGFIVRHNYNSHLFFPRKNMVKMTRIRPR